MIARLAITFSVPLWLLSCGTSASRVRGGRPPTLLVEQVLAHSWDSLLVLDSTMHADTGELAQLLEREMRQPISNAPWARALHAAQLEAVEDLRRASGVTWPVDVGGIRYPSARPISRKPQVIPPKIGFVALSALGLSHDSSMAAILMSFSCGPMCETDEVLFLGRWSPGRWQLLETRVLRQT
jgi:hypothetical protein